MRGGRLAEQSLMEMSCMGESGADMAVSVGVIIARFFNGVLLRGELLPTDVDLAVETMGPGLEAGLDIALEEAGRGLALGLALGLVLRLALL